MKLLGCISFNSNVERNKGMNKPINILDKDYLQWIKELCKRYRQSQIKAAVKVNTEMLKFYWSLGRDIVALKAEARWGSKFYKNLSKDLKEANPLATFFSPKNLLYMKNFYCMYLPYTENSQQVADQLEKKDFRIVWLKRARNFCPFRTYSIISTVQVENLQQVAANSGSEMLQ